MSAVDPRLEPSEGGLKELVLRWFTDTQAPLLLHNGSFPDWFTGFTARRDSEEQLRDKAVGCFLIRLSHKAVGYILSYRGHDRCRHFVITQTPAGQFAITGDSRSHGSLQELIEHHRVSPIQPFGEYLTSSCSQVNSGELYDVVSYSSREQPGVSVKALRTLWDQNQNQNQNQNQRLQQHAEAPPTTPHKSKSRKLTGAVSMDTVSLSQAVPPVPKRGLPLGLSLSGSLPDTSSHPSDAHSEPGHSHSLRGGADSSHGDTSYPGDLCAAGTTYSELSRVESRSRSLPRLNRKEEQEEEQEEQEEEEEEGELSASFTAPPVKTVTCHTYSLHEPRAGSGDEGSRSNPLYQTSEGPRGGPDQQGDNTYAEVPQRPEDPYEHVPGDGNTYETLEDMKTKKSKSTWGKNNMNWKKFLPEYKKK